MSRRLVAPVAVGVLAALYFTSFLTYGVQLEDEGLVLLQIARTARGELPYIDFHTGYTPGMFYLNAALFRWLGGSVVPLRAVLALVNGTLIGLLYALARRLAGPALAAAAALGYAAFLPFFVGQFASFNIPYPAWYAGLAFLGAQAALDRHLVRGSRAALVVTGVATGVAFAFKPNAGVLAGLACALTLAFLAGGARDPDRGSAAALLLVVGLALVGIIGLDVLSWEGPMLLAAPLLLVVGRLGWARASRDTGLRLWRAAGLVALGAALPTVPWLAWLALRLGPGVFVREVLLLGSGADRVYGISYPVEITFPAAGPLLVGLGVVGVAGLGLAAEAGRVRARTALAATLAAAAGFATLARLFFRMPEGIGPAIVLQVEHIPFYAAPPLAVGTAAWLLSRARAEGASIGASGRRLLGALAFACCMYLMLFPRIDTMHLIFALPSMLVLAAAAAARSGRAWATALGVSPRVPNGLVAGVAALLALASVGQNYAGLLATAGGRPVVRPQVTLATPRAPVHVEAARSEDFRALNGLFAHLAARLPADAPLFAFPALGFVAYGLGRWTPTPHDYFFPGRPDHRAEVEIVRRLDAVRPPYVVTLNRRLGFFSEAPMYYFVLRPYLAEHYVREASFGRYDVYRRRTADGPPAAPPADEPPLEELDRDALFARLADPDRDIRRAATAAFLARARTREGVTALAAAWAPDESSRLLLIRNLGEGGDERAVDFLAETYDRAGMRLRHEAANALTYLAARETTDRYLLTRDGVPPGPDALVPRRGVTTERLRAWMTTSAERRWIGIYAARALAQAGDTAAVPALEATLREERRRPSLQVAAGTALVTLGRLEHLTSLVGLLAIAKHDVQDWVPAFLIEMAGRHPVEVAAALRHGLGYADARVRETSAWVAGAAGATALGPELRAVLGDPAAEVRVAAVWALGMLGDREARPALARLAGGDDTALRAFAEEALTRLDGTRS